MYRTYLEGQRFGRLTVQHRTEGSRWHCRCDCGNEIVALSAQLKNGNTKSCGCYIKSIRKTMVRTHGLSNTGTYSAWSEAKQRCGNPRNKAWTNYGGRGIVMCDRWRESFHAFIADMGVRPHGLTLERKNNDGPYSPENCCWATYGVQGANTRKKRLLTCNGKTQHMAAWARDLGTRSLTIYMRLRRGWTVEDAVSVPVNHP